MHIKRKSALRDGRPDRAHNKNFHTYNPTQFRKSQALKQRRREIVEELIALPVTLLLLGGIFWGFWILRGVVEHV